MGKITTPLTDKQIRSLKPGPKDYVLSDGNGLQMRMRTNGSKLWNFNYIHPATGKRVNMGLGPYPDLSLAAARELAADARALVASKVDPKEHRERKKHSDSLASRNTLFNVASDWFAVKKDSITQNYGEDIWGSFERHIFPKLGSQPIHELRAPLVIEALKPIEARGNLETVKRLTQRLNEVMTFAVNTGLIATNPLGGIKASFKRPKKENMPALSPHELPEFLRLLAMANIKRTTRCVIEWQLHTMTRPSEAAGTRWDEIDIDNRLWTIPASRMKKRRDHRIPLSNQAIAILNVMHPISGHREHVFPSDKDPKTHCHSQTANMAIKRMGLEGRLVSHGLRSLASTTLNEKGFESDVIEAALAHSDENQVRSAYNRSDYLEKRTAMMNWWSKHISEAVNSSLLMGERFAAGAASDLS